MQWCPENFQQKDGGLRNALSNRGKLGTGTNLMGLGFTLAGTCTHQIGACPQFSGQSSLRRPGRPLPHVDLFQFLQFLGETLYSFFPLFDIGLQPVDLCLKAKDKLGLVLIWAFGELGRKTFESGLSLAQVPG